MRFLAALPVILFLSQSVPTEATLEAVYDVIRNALYGTVHVSTEFLKGIFRFFHGFPFLGLAADGGAAVANGTGSLAMNILKGSNQVLLPIVHGMNAVVEIPFHTALLTPLRWMLEGAIGIVGTVENNTFGAIDRMTNAFDCTYKETQGTIAGNGADEVDLVTADETVLQYVKVLNATVYSTMLTILVPLALGDTEGITGRGDELLAAASANVSVAITSLDEILSGLPDGSAAAVSAGNGLISALIDLKSSLDADSDSDGIAASVAIVIYGSIRTLVAFSDAHVSEDDFGGFFVHIIGAVAGAVNGEILELASRKVYSSVRISACINTAFAPLGIRETVTENDSFSDDEAFPSDDEAAGDSNEASIDAKVSATIVEQDVEQQMHNATAIAE